MIDRSALNRQAMDAATAARSRAGVSQFGPVDPVDLATKLNVKVVYMGASMEGFYFKGPPPRILLSSLRPVPRRTFTCAHELGHHWFGHGSTMDELKEDERSDSQKPEEVLANAFAAFLLMPSVSVRGAFARRGCTVATASSEIFFAISCEFGVGYATLINHVRYTLRDLSSSQASQLLKDTPQKIRRRMIGDGFDALLVIDRFARSRAFELEQGGAVLLPTNIIVSGEALTKLGEASGQVLYRAARRGSVSLVGMEQPSMLGVLPKEYRGAAAYRFLEDPDEEH